MQLHCFVQVDGSTTPLPSAVFFFGKEPSFKPRRTVGVASHRSFSGGNNDAGWGLKRMGCFWMGAG